jgi:hypothetical protein
VVDLIRASVEANKKSPSIRYVAKKTPDPTEHDPIAKEIGIAAGIIWQKLEKQGESPETILHQGLTIKSPYFEWAIGWLAREDQVIICLEDEPESAKDRIGCAAGVIWHALKTRGALTQTDLYKQAGVDTPICDWAIGWLARESKLRIIEEEGVFIIGLSNRAAVA